MGLDEHKTSQDDGFAFVDDTDLFLAVKTAAATGED